MLAVAIQKSFIYDVKKKPNQKGEKTHQTSNNLMESWTLTITSSFLNIPQNL